MSTELIEFIKTTVEPVKFYQSIFPDLYWSPGNNEARTSCVFHSDHNTPSLHVNGESGKWYCHGCEAGGNSIISFQAKLHSITSSQAAREIFDQFVHPLISDKNVRRYRRKLHETPSALDYLYNFRLLTDEVIDQYGLGWNGQAITIPIYNEFDLCVNLKLHDPHYKKHGLQKMYNHSEKERPESFGRPAMLFPLEIFLLAKSLGYIVVCEGEWDCLFLLSLGIPAVTSTAGDKSWPKQYNEKFRGLIVVLAYDNDKEGYENKYIIPHLRNVALEIRKIHIPKIEKVKDVLSWAKKDVSMRKRSSWKTEIREAKIILQNTKEIVEQSERQIVSLDQASQAKYYNKPLQIDALIQGKPDPYMVPKKFRVSCNQKCDECPLAKKEQAYRDGSFPAHDPRLLRMMDISDAQIRKMLLDAVKMPCTPLCEPKVDTLETYNIEPIVIIPTLDSRSAQHVTRIAYYVGHGLYSNRAYQFQGTTLPNPKDQQSTHLFTHAKPVQDEVDTFEMSRDLRESLKIFQPGRKKLSEHFKSIAEWQSVQVTKIRERPDLHILVDLVFHSVVGFEFNGEYVRRGMLDALIIGDTRCGKGYVTEGLRNYYNLGEIASGENCTFAGLIAGVQPIAKRWVITWGLIPLNHHRLVVIDEASALSESDFSQLSRVRSEGIAEVNKIVRDTTQASTRLIWLANTRSGQKIRKYAKGVQAIKELVGANEDISRFDIAMTVAADEVSSEIINAPPLHADNPSKYPAHLCKSLVMWAWSRRPDQIRFSDEAVTQIMQESIRMGHQYSSDIPLVQAENIRIKIAKLSAAVAARVFSTKDGEILQIEKSHVEYAVEFMNELYSKPSMAYDLYSKQTKAATTLHDVKQVASLFETFGNDRIHIMRGLNEVYRINQETLGDFVGDNNTARAIISDLVKLNCLTRTEKGGNWYVKNPEFNVWLANQLERKNPNGKSSESENGNGKYRDSDTFNRNRRF